MNYNAYPYGRWIKWAIIGVLVLIILVSGASNYNGLVAVDQDVQSYWSQVENQMQRRADVITNLVKVVKGYTKHEEKVFGEIAAARSVLLNSGSDVNSKLAAGQKIESSAKQILALVENYPELKSSDQFVKLQDQIEGSENRVTVARMDFINSVKNYNTRIKRFPGNIFAGIMGFTAKDYFKAESGANQSPDINFD